METSDIRLPSSAIVGGNAPKVNLPAGVILPYAGGSIPSNVIPCDGRTLDRVEHDLLFQAIGTTWGAPSGSTFNVPDFRDRALYGVGSFVGLGGTDGVANGSRGGPRHKHSFGQTSGGGGGHSHSGSTNDPGSHTHPSPGSPFALTTGGTAALGSGGTARYLVTDYNFATGGGGSHSHSLSINSVGDHTHFVSGDTSGGFLYDKPSYAGINYVITTGKQV